MSLFQKVTLWNRLIVYCLVTLESVNRHSSVLTSATFSMIIMRMLTGLVYHFSMLAFALDQMKVLDERLRVHQWHPKIIHRGTLMSEPNATEIHLLVVEAFHSEPYNHNFMMAPEGKVRPHGDCPLVKHNPVGQLWKQFITTHYYILLKYIWRSWATASVLLATPQNKCFYSSDKVLQWF